MGFAVGYAAADRSSDAGGVGGIDEVHVEADGNAGGVVHGVLYRVGHDFAHAALIDVSHGENVDAGFFGDLALVGVEIARANDHDVAWLSFRLESHKINEFRSAVAHDAGERHAVDVAGRRRVRRVHVAVSVEPDVADVFFLLAVKAGDTCGDSGGDGVIAA